MAFHPVLWGFHHIPHILVVYFGLQFLILLCFSSPQGVSFNGSSRARLSSGLRLLHFRRRGCGPIIRLLLAVYHPRNRYLLHISADGADEERLRLGALVKSVPAIRAFGNVDVIGKPDPNTYMGSTNLAAILRAAAVLLKVDRKWDWFVTLSALDYPLITQDGSKNSAIVVDPGTYLARRTQIFHATEKRPMPDAFRVFAGSPWLY
ncbi:Beta-glucuronosyltransferase GlcAT14A [Sesamum angolense]|uniref:Beta-glucuronosyltransferase GlcAT14A n=1 Tax=Sesamum angolense TaxID=2727404 RepID=A0AAE1WVQ7_9LAMI|nr:Beta-glucuronosyltransferase GlcAT14A [Sesamum angolense]